MKDYIPEVLPYDKTSAKSIFDYSKGLLGNTLRDFVWDEYVNERTNHGYGCPYLSGKRIWKG